ncbi:MaoC family dehydratase N-terminal domain-containing protein [Chromobacterium alkanivorans]|nr:MaoC family dehydratase N-terminal domain-containing protein [Chromobacterium alkanivorans]
MRKRAGAVFDIKHVNQWLGKRERRDDWLAPAPAAALASLLGRAGPPPEPGEALPPLWHWLYFNRLSPPEALGADGHPRRGGFLPPVELPRRMWAGGRVEWLQPLRLGERASRDSRIAAIQDKSGRSGPLLFLTLRHEISGENGLALVEEQDLVYCRPPAADQAAAPPAPIPATPWRRALRADDVLLFGYSALTLNTHRIHYNRDYATGSEGYPGLVVHGPLLATLLLELCGRSAPGFRPGGFRFRSLRPLFENTEITLGGLPDPADRMVALWAWNAAGQPAMEARLQWAPDDGA